MSTTSSFVLQTVKPEFTATSLTTDEQRLPTILHLSGGGFVVAYVQDTGYSFGGLPVLDFYGPDNQLLYSTPRIPYADPGITYTEQVPALVELSTGNVMLVWANSIPGHQGIRASIFTPGGTPVSSEMTLTFGSAGGPSVIALGDGGFALTYTAQSTAFLRRYDAAGNQQGALVEVSPGQTWNAHQDEPQMTELAGGGYAVTWWEWVGSQDNGSIHARIFDADWTPRTGPFAVDTVGTNSHPMVTALANGNWAIAYDDTGWSNETGSSGITLKIMSPTGGNVGSAVHVNAPNPLDDHLASMTVLANGQILMTWNKEVAVGTFDVYGRLFAPSGDPVAIAGSTNEFLLSSSASYGAETSGAGAGRFITVANAETNGDLNAIAAIRELVRATVGDGADDTFTGDMLRDIVSGGDGNDTLNGGAGDDNISGGAGLDTLVGGRGNDTLSGGANSDVFVYRPSDGADTILDFATGPAIRDRIALDGGGLMHFSDVLAKTSQVGANAVIDFGSGNTITLVNVQKTSLTADNFFGLAIDGDDGSNVLSATPVSDVIDGRGGDDTVVFAHNFNDYTVYDYGARIMVTGPDGIDALFNVEHLRFADATIDVVDDGNPLFDTLYYLSRNADVFHSGMNALDHFNTFGWHEGRDPNPWFDTSAYLAANKDVAASGANPLEHYHQTGWHQGRDPGPNFDTTLYLINNPDVEAAGIDPLAHFEQFGAAEGRKPFKAIGQTVAGGFDAEYYLFHNPDVAAAGIDPLTHYNAFGWHEGRNPNAWFNTSGYLSHYADVAASGANPLQHYEQFGWQEGRDPSSIFDTLGYLAANPDVAAAHINPLDHFLQNGIYEGRLAINDAQWH